MAYRVRVEPLGEVIHVERGQTILDAALRSGVHLPHACSRGVCSACKIEVLEGEVDIGEVSNFALLDSERADNQCLACCATPLSDLVIEADIEGEPDAQHHKVGDYQAVVTSIKDLAPQIKSIFLALDGDGLEFQAGQYVNLYIPGAPENPRAFSIASPPSSRNVIELNVALIEGGKATRYLHNELAVGDILSFSGPYGQFYVRKSQPEPIIFLAGGSGLSGVKSMIMELVESNDQRPFTLIFGARSQEEVYYQALFEQYAMEHPRFTFLLAINGSASPACSDNQWGGLQELGNRHFKGKFAGYNAYVCGPPQMVDSCVVTLMQGRCFEKHLFVEKFYNKGSNVDESNRIIFKRL